MANTTLRGLRWVRSDFGQFQHPVETVRVASGYGTAIYRGDCVVLVDNAGVQTAERAVGSEGTKTDVYGVVIGVKQYWDGTYMQRGRALPASTTYGSVIERASLLEVIPVFGQVFEVDCDDTSIGTTLSSYQTNAGANADLIIESVTGASGFALDASSLASTATLQVRYIGPSKGIDQDYASSRVKVQIRFNRAQHPATNTTGI